MLFQVRLLNFSKYAVGLLHICYFPWALSQRHIGRWMDISLDLIHVLYWQRWNSSILLHLFCSSSSHLPVFVPVRLYSLRNVKLKAPPASWVQVQCSWLPRTLLIPTLTPQVILSSQHEQKVFDYIRLLNKHFVIGCKSFCRCWSLPCPGYHISRWLVYEGVFGWVSYTGPPCWHSKHLNSGSLSAFMNRGRSDS